MNADAHYNIGASHKVCQDYALAGTYKDISYVILSDGCSESKDSDLGARLLCHIAKEVLLHMHSRKIFYDYHRVSNGHQDLIEELILAKTLEVRQALHLPYEVFDATLIILTAIGDIRCLYWRGDGYIAFRYKLKEIRGVPSESL